MVLRRSFRLIVCGVNECHRTLLGHVVSLISAKQFLSERVLYSGTRSLNIIVMPIATQGKGDIK